MKFLLRALFLGLGLALFGWFIHRAEPRQMLAQFTALGWLTPMIFLPYAFVYLADTRGWQFTLGEKARSGPPFLTLVRIRWAGEAINNVVPSAYLGGEAVKVYLLNKRGVPLDVGATSVVAGKTAQTLSQIVFLSLAACALAQIKTGEARVQFGAIVIITALCLAVFGLIWLQRAGPLSVALRLLDKIGLRLESVRNKMEKLRRIDDRIIEFYRHDRRHFCFSLALYFAGWLLGVSEVLVIAALLGMPLQISQAVVLEAFVSVAKVFGIVVPGALGFQESGIVILGRAVALADAFAIAYAILRRGREVVFALIGLLFVYSEEMTFKEILNRAETE